MKNVLAGALALVFAVLCGFQPALAQPTAAQAAQLKAARDGASAVEASTAAGLKAIRDQLTALEATLNVVAPPVTPPVVTPPAAGETVNLTAWGRTRSSFVVAPGASADFTFEVKAATATVFLGAGTPQHSLSGNTSWPGGTAWSTSLRSDTGAISMGSAARIAAGLKFGPGAKVDMQIDGAAKRLTWRPQGGAWSAPLDISAWGAAAINPIVGVENGTATIVITAGAVTPPVTPPVVIPPVADNDRPMLGMNPGNESAVITEALNWVKRPDGKTATQILGMNLARDSWPNWVRTDWLWNFMNGAQAPGESYRGWRGHLNLTTSLILEPKGASSMAAAARGDYRAYYRQQAQNIKAALLPGQKLYIRPSNEFNGTWFDHSTPAKNTPADFIGAWNVLGEEYEAVFGADAIGKTVFFVWCFNIGQSDPEIAWPGPKYVHIIEIDFYWSWLDHRNVRYDQAFEFFRTHSNGLQRQVDLARKYGKKPGIGEYGVGSFDAADRKKPGDDTRAGATLVQQNAKPFFDDLSKWLVANDYEYHIYFGRDIPGDVFAKMSSGPGVVGSETFKGFALTTGGVQ